MKNLSLLFVLIAGFTFAASSVFATGVRAEFKAYDIEDVNDLYMGKSVKAIWTVSYSDEEVPVTVVKRKTWDGTEYVVHSKYFEVSYASTVDGFGAKEVRKSWSSVPKKINTAVINQEELKRQEIITPNKVDDERALGLIANFLPALINDGYTHLLN